MLLPLHHNGSCHPSQPPTSGFAAPAIHFSTAAPGKNRKSIHPTTSNLQTYLGRVKDFLRDVAHAPRPASPPSTPRPAGVPCCHGCDLSPYENLASDTLSLAKKRSSYYPSGTTHLTLTDPTTIPPQKPLSSPARLSGTNT